MRDIRARENASKAEPAQRFHSLIVRQELFEEYRPKTFSEACRDLAT
ncbi:MAG: hypothetical protein OJF50_003154 [Nitrospira sp.]|nr:hypothetical protein [Nitrospira sp.]